MGKVTTNILFDKDFLNKLRNDPNACVDICKETYHLALHPFHLTDVKASIKLLLNEKIAKYDKKLCGILLGYQNIQVLSSAGAINFDSCFIHFNIQAEFYIFKLDIGQILTGVVNKKSKDHIGCLVHKTFNVSLPRPENCENWLGHSAQLGQDVQFEITFTNLDGKLPYIRGKILSVASDDSGFSTSEEPIIKSDEIERTEKSKKKKKRKRDDSSFDENTDDIICKPKEKKAKRCDNNISGEITFSDTEIIENQKKKKRKKNKTEDTYAEVTMENEEFVSSNEVKKSKKKKEYKQVDELEAAEDINNIPEKSQSISEKHKVHKKHKHKDRRK